MRWLLLMLCACGRIGFDATTRASDGALVTDTITIDGMTVPAGPAVWLRMETDPTTGIVDSGGGHTVTCTTACPQPVAGKRGQGYQFSMNEVDVKPATDLDSSNGFTGAVWVKIGLMVVGPNECPWSKPFNNANGEDTFALCVQNDGQVIYDGETAGGTTVSETSGVNIVDGTWHHIAVTWDGTTKRDWLDGAQVGFDTLAPGAGNENLALGGARSSFYVIGAIDEAIYYTRALTPAEIGLLATP